MLSTIDRIIFLKEVSFFQTMTVQQLKVLASLCEEKIFEKDSFFFKSGDPGGVLYIIVNGRVGIEYEKRPGSFARLGEVNAYAYFGEANFFDGSPQTTSAVAIVDTLTLQLRREPIIEMTIQNPNLALSLIHILTLRLRTDNERLADLTRSQIKSMDNLFDKLG